MRMPNPIVQRPTCDDLRTYPTCQKFQYRNLNCPASFWRTNDRGKRNEGRENIMARAAGAAVPLLCQAGAYRTY